MGSPEKIRFLLCKDSEDAEEVEVLANHYLVTTSPYCELKENQGNKKCWVWTAQDSANGEAEIVQFALRFASEELAARFKDAFDSAKNQNEKLGDASGKDTEVIEVVSSDEEKEDAE